MKINKVLFILLCSFVNVSTMQWNSSRSLLGRPSQPQSIMQMFAPRAQTPTPQNIILNLNEWKTVTRAIVDRRSANELFRELNEFFNDPSIIQIAMNNDRTKIILYKDNEPEDPIEQAFDISPADLQLFSETHDNLQNPPVLAQADGQQDSQTAVSELPAPAPVRTNTTTTLPASTTTTVTNTPAAVPPVSSVSTPAAQQPIVPAEDPVKKKKKDDQTDENSKDKYLPYGYNPYDPNGKDSPSSGGQPSPDQPQQGGGGGRSSRGGKGGNDPYGGYGDSYPGMGGDYYGNPMSVYGGGGGMHFDRASGSVGSALSEQVGFAISKPSTTQPQFVTHADVKKLSSQGKSTTIVPQTSTDDTPIDTTYQRTLQLEPEVLFHNRKTEPTKRLHIAPVKEEPVAPLNEAPNDTLPKIEKKPVSFFHSLWNTVTQPLVTVMSWFLSFVYRK